MAMNPTRIRILILLAKLLVVFWIIGFVFFAISVKNYPVLENYKDFDCMVVFTGGKGRVEKALDIFNNNSNINKLLISGVWNGTTIDDLITKSNIRYNSITLGRFAKNTIQNAVEADIWSVFHRCNKTVVITSDYHTIRSNYVLRRISDNDSLELYGISPINDVDSFQNSMSRLKLIFIEYNKYLFTIFISKLGFFERDSINVFS